MSCRDCVFRGTFQDMGASCDVCNLQSDDCRCVKQAEALYDKGYRKASEIAREIFAEIEGIMAYFPIYGHANTAILNENDFAELKKKYTEIRDDDK